MQHSVLLPRTACCTKDSLSDKNYTQKQPNLEKRLALANLVCIAGIVTTLFTCSCLQLHTPLSDIGQVHNNSTAQPGNGLQGSIDSRLN